MPTFRCCISAVLLLTLAFSSVATAKPGDRLHSAGNNALRRDSRPKRPSLAGRSHQSQPDIESLDKRKAAALRRAAVKVQRKRVEESKRAGVVPNSVHASRSELSAKNALESRQRTYRMPICSTDVTCLRAPAGLNSNAVCNSGVCAYVCITGYTGLTGLAIPNSACSPSPITCPNQKRCPVVLGFGGYNVCNRGGLCQASCQQGYTVFKIAGRNYCYDVLNDARNCGVPGKVCPNSYNGSGSPLCAAGRCTLSCPSPQRLQRTRSAAFPMQCV